MELIDLHGHSYWDRWAVTDEGYRRLRCQSASCDESSSLTDNNRDYSQLVPKLERFLVAEIVPSSSLRMQNRHDKCSAHS